MNCCGLGDDLRAGTGWRSPGSTWCRESQTRVQQRISPKRKNGKGNPPTLTPALGKAEVMKAMKHATRTGSAIEKTVRFRSSTALRRLISAVVVPPRRLDSALDTRGDASLGRHVHVVNVLVASLTVNSEGDRHGVSFPSRRNQLLTTKKSRHCGLRDGWVRMPIPRRAANHTLQKTTIVMATLTPVNA